MEGIKMKKKPKELTFTEENVRRKKVIDYVNRCLDMIAAGECDEITITLGGRGL